MNGWFAKNLMSHCYEFESMEVHATRIELLAGWFAKKVVSHYYGFETIVILI